MMQALKQLASHATPAGRPQPIAFHNGLLWVGCWDDVKLYAIDPKTWTVKDEVALPGRPYGLASFDGALRVVVSIGDDDDRYLYRFVPGKSFGEEGRQPCPDLTGSHLATNGKALYLVQQTHRQLLELDAAGAAKQTIPMSTRCAGLAFKGDTLYTIAADDEFDVLEFATLDIETTGAAPAVLAPMHVEARGLAFDGDAWWTSYREEGTIVSFAA